MKRDARLAILEAGAELVHKKGFHNTGIKEILDLAQVPKGSFYFYFPSKEAFGLALIDHFRDSRAPIIAQILSDPTRPPLKRLARFLAGARERFANWGCERGCPFGNLAQELSDLSPAMREALRASLDGLSQSIGRVLAEAARQGDLPEGLDPEETAAFIMDAWEGAILRMKAEKSVEPLLRFEKLLFARVLNAPLCGGQTEQETATG
ncbi:transcriptional regulator, TetR family [Alkalidesulfovibrio alkalitolerans DSM 16529]|uniref:Transcriptional regulator, TetR family n=1 Tax=Alkalidesulfovibrio alkalitolerans DSM 16529 TaxID=1121439 RepID=S7UV94_9BACT|nr:TetR/AcrR family transcriptional regulator [Alkalidesulfovibrio alkalitolerans]EPR36258.1 transcriptional regulator, TetR family [Alkalidesulfovibrio alkalitolerans DSM 16529]